MQILLADLIEVGKLCWNIADINTRDANFCCSSIDIEPESNKFEFSVADFDIHR